MQLTVHCSNCQIFHSGPGNAYSLHEEPHHERQDVLRAQSYIKEKCTSISTITHLQHAICNMPMHVECVVQYVFRCEFEWHSSLLFSGTHMPCLVSSLFSFASPCAMDPT